MAARLPVNITLSIYLNNPFIQHFNYLYICPLLEIPNWIIHASPKNKIKIKPHQQIFRKTKKKKNDSKCIKITFPKLYRFDHHASEMGMESSSSYIFLSTLKY